MKILHLQSLHGHAPWMQTVSRLARGVDAITIAGDCLPIVRRDGDVLELINWIARLRRPVFYSRGAYDATNMDAWKIPHLRRAGTHELDGVAIHVIDNFTRDAPPLRESTLPGVVVSYYPPAATLCALDEPHGEHRGRMDVREALTHLGDVRLALCGCVTQPRARGDWCEGALVCVPGFSHQEHDYDPAFIEVDFDARTLRAYDGRRMTSISFER